MTSERNEKDGTPFSPIDSDVDLHTSGQRQELSATHGLVLAVIAAGGALGALARYGLAQVWPTHAGGFPWATFVTNVAGCFLIGVLMVVITDIRKAHPLTRPFLGVGILGGFTTFSTYANETRALIQPGTVALAFTYLAATLLCALLAALAAMRLTRGVHAAALRRGQEVAR
ncbi:CrcB family protein [Nocardia sp. NPDC006630]|uniref:fluoride efflux transporter FluC n=1 Tax=Nocardia sp. NPDC006630 TaxID=3157181 RepID=UPI0033B785CA